MGLWLIIQVFDVVDTGLGHVIGMDYARYPADGMQFVAKVIQCLGGAIAEVRSLLGAGLAHRIAVASWWLAHFDGFGVNDENILFTVKELRDTLAYIFTQSSREFATVIVLAAWNQMRQFAAVVLNLAEQITLALLAHGLLGQVESNDLEVAELGDDATPGHISLVSH